MEESWEAATIPVVDYIRKDTYILGDLTHLDSLLLDTDLTLHRLLHSQHALHIKSETVKWKNIHTIIRQTLVSAFGKPNVVRIDFEHGLKSLEYFIFP